MGNCQLTLRPYFPFGPPAFTHQIESIPITYFDSLSNFAVFPVENGISFNDNLGDIVYSGQCTGSIVRIYSEPDFRGKLYEVTLTKDDGNLLLPCKIINTASSISVLRIIEPDGQTLSNTTPEQGRTLSITTAESIEVDLQKYYDAGLLTNDALNKLKEENPETIKAKLQKLQEDPQVIKELELQAPLTLEQIINLLKEEAN